LPASGKTTLAGALIEHFRAAEIPALWLDSDDLRPYVIGKSTYSDEERDRFYAMVGHLAVLGAAGGVTVVVSATASKRRYRDEVRQVVKSFWEVWLQAEHEVLTKRDPRGLYKLAANGEIENFPGSPGIFEEPQAAELELRTDQHSTEALVHAVLDCITPAAN